MQELAAELGNYIAGGLTLEQLQERVRRLIAMNPGRVDEAVNWVQAGVKNGRVSTAVGSILAEVLNETRRSRTVEREQAPASLAKSSVLSVGTVLKGRYTLIEELGRGGMGQVFKARDQNKVDAQDRNPYLALKALSEEFARHPDAYIALEREARRAQELAHPNVIKVFDFDRDGPTVFMTMEYLIGVPLDKLLRTEYSKGLSMALAWPIIDGIGSALRAAHENNIVHSDLKPSNVFMCAKGVVKVLDFGISRPMGVTGATASETLFDPAKRLGFATPAYASLEQLTEQPPDPRDDIYAFACVAYELLTGQHPFAKAPADKAEESRLVPQRIESLNRRQWNALRRGLIFRRDKRIGSIKEFLHALTPPSFLRKYSLLISSMTIAALIIGGFLATHYFRNYITTVEVGEESCTPAPGVKLNAAQQQEVDDALFLAQDAVRDLKLGASPDELAYVLSEGANNVNQILDGVLDYKTCNLPAIELKSKVAELYLQKARQLMERDENAAAIKMVRYGRKTAPHNIDLYNMESRICNSDVRLCAANQN